MRKAILLSLLFPLLTSCNLDKEEDAAFPNIRQEFFTAHFGENGRISSLLADNGKLYEVSVDKTGLTEKAGSMLRLIGNIEWIPTTQQEAKEAIVYAASKTISHQPLRWEELQEEVGKERKHAPAEVLSIWMGWDYVNVVLTVKAQDKKHVLRFIEEKVETTAEGMREVYIKLYHDANGDHGYTQRGYLSIPLKTYRTPEVGKLTVHFTLYSSGEGGFKTYSVTK